MSDPSTPVGDAQATKKGEFSTELATATSVDSVQSSDLYRRGTVVTPMTPGTPATPGTDVTTPRDGIQFETQVVREATNHHTNRSQRVSFKHNNVSDGEDGYRSSIDILGDTFETPWANVVTGASNTWTEVDAA